MKKGRKPAAPKLRECFYCRFPIAESRPVFLVATDLGKIIGPLHAGCAEKIVLENGKHPLGPGMNGEMYGRLGPQPRGEGWPS